MKAQNETVPSLVHSETPIGKGKVKDECKSLFCWYSLNFEKKVFAVYSQCFDCQSQRNNF